MPVTAVPDAASAVMAWLPSPVRPLTGERVQLVPSAEVQTAAAVVPPDEPNCAAAVKPPPLAVSPVKLTPGPGAVNGTGCQVLPPSAERSARGCTPCAVVCWPSATAWLPLTATCWITPAVAPAGSVVLTAVQVRPSELIHTTGRFSCEPADTKPAGPAATASTRLEPPVSFTSRALAQVTRSCDHQTSREYVPPVSATVPVIT